MTSKAVSKACIREALTAGTTVKEKGPPVADGHLSVTPDTPEVVEWRSRSALDVAETSSTYLDDDEDGGSSAQKKIVVINMIHHRSVKHCH